MGKCANLVRITGEVREKLGRKCLGLGKGMDCKKDKECHVGMFCSEEGKCEE
jgi:hypothetical protein